MEKLLTVEEVGELLRLAPRTVRNWVHTRRIPYRKIGGKVLFHPATIEAWSKRKEIPEHKDWR